MSTECVGAGITKCVDVDSGVGAGVGSVDESAAISSAALPPNITAPKNVSIARYSKNSLPVRRWPCD